MSFMLDFLSYAHCLLSLLDYNAIKVFFSVFLSVHSDSYTVA